MTKCENCGIEEEFHLVDMATDIKWCNVFGSERYKKAEEKT